LLNDGFSASPAALLRRGDQVGPLTPRQRAYRQGKYQRAPAGTFAGTLSIPDVPNGWQRNSRASVIHPPAQRP
jgi:hypothetical protein